MKLKDKIAVVTGGNRGIGKSIALTLAQNGASLAICGTNEVTLKETAIEIEKTGVKCLAHKVDVSKVEAVETFSKAVFDTFGKVDVLVNNAGITKDNLLIRMSEQEWDDVLDINLKSTFLMTKAFVRPMMKARQGRIINITSIIGIRETLAKRITPPAKRGSSA